MTNKEKFIDTYQKAIDSEFKHFNAQADLYHFEDSGKYNKMDADKYKGAVDYNANQFVKHKEELQNINLSPKEAKEILQMKYTSEEGFFDLNGIQGSDTYRFMNSELKKKPDVALEAYKADSRNQKHFPLSLKEKVQGKDVEKSLNNAIQYEAIREQIKPKQSHSQTLSMAI